MKWPKLKGISSARYNGWDRVVKVNDEEERRWRCLLDSSLFTIFDAQNRKITITLQRNTFMRIKSKLIATAVLLGLSTAAGAQSTLVLNLDSWQFSRDSVAWQAVKVPHDWAISGPFDKKWDLQNVAIEQNGETEKTEKSGRSGALPWIGKGYYTTKFAVPSGKQRVFVYFDGAMSEPHVYVNGHLAAYWPYGYNAFRAEITPYVHSGENTIAVSLQNLEESSRWYPGAGLYRPVHVICTNRVVIDPWQTFIRTVTANQTTATVAYDTRLDGVKKDEKLFLHLSLRNAKGMEVANGKAVTDEKGRASTELKVKHPQLWSPESPYLYKLITTVYTASGKVKLAEQTTNVGIRTLRFSKEKGFELNGMSRKFKGVCLHHDLGPLGAAVNKAALIRQVKQLKDMGCDAIRTAHNMPSQMQMEVYDSLGMMVMAESFDTWIYPKVKNGYARFFKDWADKDIETLVRNHRNHPSLVMYSIGNEIPEQWSEEGARIVRRLVALCHKLDATRPVTQGMDKAEDALKSGFAQAHDVAGWNYRVQKYDRNIRQLPQGFQLGSETASTVSSRGVYKFPVEIKYGATYDDGQCSGYDTEYCSWSNLPDIDFMIQEDRKNTIGQFVWTGYDYLGEPSPYDEYWPSRSSYFGIMDLAGLPKDRFYLYRSVWNSDNPTLHLLPHWTWGKAMEGKNIPVFCYTNYPEAELFVNGKSQGRVKKKYFTVSDAADLEKKEVIDSLLIRYRLRWNNVKYEPGELKVVAYDAEGRRAGEQIVRTAGAEAALKLETDRHELTADGNDLAYITVSMTDDKGTLCPDAADELEVEVSGVGTFRAICNGDATSLEVFTEPHMRLFHGQLVVTVQAGKQAGNMLIKVKTSDGRIAAQQTIAVVK